MKLDGKSLKTHSMNQSSAIQRLSDDIYELSLLCEPNRILSLDTLKDYHTPSPTLHKIKKVDYNNGRRSGRAQSG